MDLHRKTRKELIKFACHSDENVIKLPSVAKRLGISRRVGMADEADSKSVVGNYVRVQVPPPAV